MEEDALMDDVELEDFDLTTGYEEFIARDPVVAIDQPDEHDDEEPTLAQPPPLPITSERVKLVTDTLKLKAQTLSAPIRNYLDRQADLRAKLSLKLRNERRALKEYKAHQEAGTIPRVIDQGTKVTAPALKSREEIAKELKKSVLDDAVNQREARCTATAQVVKQFPAQLHGKLGDILEEIGDATTKIGTAEGFTRHWIYHVVMVHARDLLTQYTIKNVEHEEAKRKKQNAAEEAKQKRTEKDDAPITVGDFNRHLAKLKKDLKAKPAAKKPSPGTSAASANSKKSRGGKRKQPGSRPAKRSS